MATYVYSKQQIERAIDNARRFRIWLCVAAAIILLFFGLLLIDRPGSPVFREPVRGWVEAILSPILVVPLFRIIKNRKTWTEEMRRSLAEIAFEISPGKVSVLGPKGFKRQFNMSEIVRADEPSLGRGLYLRTANRYRWMLIARKFENYEAIKRELAGQGVLVVQTSVLPNWEEYVGVVLFCGTLLCSTSNDVLVLKLNLLVAFLLSFAFLFVITSNNDAVPRSRLRLAKIGSFLPLVFAAFGLWLRLRN